MIHVQENCILQFSCFFEIQQVYPGKYDKIKEKKETVLGKGISYKNKKKAND